MSMIIVYELNIQVHHPAWGVLIMALLYIIPTACSLIRYRNKHRRNELYNKSHLYYRQHKRKCNRIYWGSWLFPFLLFALWIVSLLLRQ